MCYDLLRPHLNLLEVALLWESDIIACSRCMLWRLKMQEIKITVWIKLSNMYDFLLRYNYKGMAGIIGPVFSILAFLALCLSYSVLTRGQIVLLIIASLLFTVINPLLILLKAAKQLKYNPAFREPLVYTLTEEKIVVTQNKEVLPIPWKNVQEVEETHHNLIVYLSKVRAFVLPKENIGNQLVEVRELIRRSVKTGKVRLKKEEKQ